MIVKNHNVLVSVSDSSHFKDDDQMLYEFKINFRRQLALLDLVIPPEPDSEEEVCCSPGFAPSILLTGIQYLYY